MQPKEQQDISESEHATEAQSAQLESESKVDSTPYDTNTNWTRVRGLKRINQLIQQKANQNRLEILSIARENIIRLMDKNVTPRAGKGIQDK